MNSISEIILSDGEVLSMDASESQKQFDHKILSNLDFESVKSFFIKKCVLEAVKEKHNLTNGSNGVTQNEFLNLLKWNDIEPLIAELEQKKIIKKRQGINLEMYFLNKK
jgi:hypothetical protein